MEEKAVVKHNPTRIRLPKYGNALMLCMEYLVGTANIITNIKIVDDHFDIYLRVSTGVAQSLKSYINANL